MALEVDDVLARRGARLEVFSAHDPDGSRYLVAHTRGHGRAGTWLCAPVTERALACVQSGRAELREFEESVRLCAELTDEELPQAGIRVGVSARCA